MKLFGINCFTSNICVIYKLHITSLGGVAVWRRTRDRKVAGSNPVRGAINSTRSSQPSVPPR